MIEKLKNEDVNSAGKDEEIFAGPYERLNW